MHDKEKGNIMYLETEVVMVIISTVNLFFVYSGILPYLKKWQTVAWCTGIAAGLSGMLWPDSMLYEVLTLSTIVIALALYANVAYWVYKNKRLPTDWL